MDRKTDRQTDRQTNRQTDREDGSRTHQGHYMAIIMPVFCTEGVTFGLVNPGLVV